MPEWLLAATVLIAVIAILPRVLANTKRSRRASGGSGVFIAIGMALSLIFDPKSTQTTEWIAQKRDEKEDEESGDKPL